MSFLELENQCKENSYSQYKEAPITTSIRKLYNEQRIQNSQNFLFVSPRIYNFENPLVLSVKTLTDSYKRMRQLQAPNQADAEDLFYLYIASQRFENQKCSLQSLIEKKKLDIRPFISTAHACYEKYQTENCGEADKQDTLSLCRSFNKDGTCLAEFENNKRRGTLNSMVKYYYQRFEDERYGSLFRLRPQHLRFNCSKGDKTIMTIKVFGGTLEHGVLVDLLNYVKEVWKNERFEIRFEIVQNQGPDIVSLVPTNRSISYVEDNNPHTIYLGLANEYLVTKKVLAHEFGHVLGFPDCYIEFFDDTKKELVYYEISKQNMNIMCSMKDGVQVQEDNFRDLEEKSCIF